jgi:hypothetical protein
MKYAPRATVILLVASSLVTGCGGAVENSGGLSAEDARSDATVIGGGAEAAADVVAGDTTASPETNESGVNDVTDAAGDVALVDAPVDSPSGPDAADAPEAGCPALALGTCVPGAAQCSGNAVARCDSSGPAACPVGLWRVAVPCANQACVSGACTGVCAPGSTLCSGGALQICTAAGQWGTPTACPGSCGDAGSCN